MERVAIVVRLKQGSGLRAAQLIEAGPPFDLAQSGIFHHSVYLSAGEVVFVFEGPQVEWIVDDLVDIPSTPRSGLHSSGGGPSSTARPGSLANSSAGECRTPYRPLMT
jgi:hypothetical protein